MNSEEENESIIQEALGTKPYWRVMMSGTTKSATAKRTKNIIATVQAFDEEHAIELIKKSPEWDFTYKITGAYKI